MMAAAVVPTVGASAQTARIFLGVSLSFLKSIKADSRYKEGMTVRNVSHNIVKPDTLSAVCTYCSLFQDQCDSGDRLYVAPATHFISYARDYPYDVLLDVFEHQHPTGYGWIDLFIEPQHGNGHKTVEMWQTIFRDPIIHIGKVTLVIFPWNKPKVVQRSWCLWEIFSAIQGGGCRFSNMSA